MCDLLLHPEAGYCNSESVTMQVQRGEHDGCEIIRLSSTVQHIPRLFGIYSEKPAALPLERLLWQHRQQRDALFPLSFG